VKPGPGPAATTPLLDPAQAGLLLEQVIYERLVELVDFDALYRLEQSLALALFDMVPQDRVFELARALVDRAWGGLLDDPRRYADLAADEAFACRRCDDELRRRVHDDGAS